MTARRQALASALLAALALGAGTVPAQDVTSPLVAAREFTLDLPVSTDGRTVGDMTVVIGAAGLVAIDVASWREFGPRQFAPDIVEQLAAQATSGRIPVAAFEAAGLTLRYDPGELVLHLQPQSDQRVLRSLSMRPPPGSAVTDSAEGRLAAYMNIRGLQDRVRGTGNADSTVRVLLDGAVRTFGPRGAALEWSTTFDEAATGRWTRGELRLVHDDAARAIRYTAGDINFLTTEFQGAVPLLGVSAERRFATLHPARTVASTGPRSFTLTRPSRVDIFINGAMQRSFQLDAGRYGLSDFGTVDGANDVRIEVVDDTGQRQVIEFTLFLDATLLRRGESEFSVNAGVRRRDGARNRIAYDSDRSAWSGFLRYGLTDTVTAGTSLQGEPGLQVLGLEAVTASPVGTFSTSLSWSDSARFGRGSAGTARWSYDFSGRDGAATRRLDLSTIRYDRRYVSLGVDEVFNRYSSQTQARLTSLLPFGIAGSVNARYARTRDPLERDEMRLGFAMSRRIGIASATWGVERITGEENDTRGYLNVLVPLGRDQSVLASWQSLDDQARVEWSRYPTERVGNVSGTVGLESTGYGRSATADLAYVGNRFAGRLEHDIARLDPRARGSVERTRLQFDTALAYVDGQVAVGRPVTDAFVLVSRHPTLRGSRVLVDPSDRGPIAVADRFGPALLPRLLSYRMQQVRWDVTDVPDGYDLGDTVRYLQPHYRSGYHFEVGSDASLAAVGTAQLPDGTPLTLVAGELRADDGRPFTPAKTFTNRTGRFSVQGLAPGRYAIVFLTDPPRSIRFTVSKDTAGLLNLGTLTAE